MTDRPDRPQSIPVIVTDPPDVQHERAPVVRVPAPVVDIVARRIAADVNERATRPPATPGCDTCAWIDDGYACAECRDRLAPRLSPAAHRLIATAVGDFREAIGLDGKVTPHETIDGEDGTALVSVMVRVDVRAINAFAQALAEQLTDDERAVLAALNGEWRSVAVIAARAGVSDDTAFVVLGRLWGRGMAAEVGGMWRRIETTK